MQRKVDRYLNKWLTTHESRKPLVIRGARQVGKTWVVRKLAKDSKLALLEFNFERNPELVNLFSSNDPKEILMNIEASQGITIKPRECILFLDEIQAAPKLLAKLRWFYEAMPELAVIAAGSLLEFVLEDHDFSMPVGRIEYCHLEPLSFEEFIQALGKEKLIDYIAALDLTKTFPESIHAQLIELIKHYSIIGGMPEAVHSWVNNQSFADVHKIQQNVVATYRDDFHKYAKKISVEHLHAIFSAVPNYLSKKFVFSKVNLAVATAVLKRALHLLSKARVCHIIYASAANGVPLGAELKDTFFKVIFLDIGLVSAPLGLDITNIHYGDSTSLVNQGGISEQLVGQLLRTLEHFYIEPMGYYWIREEKGSSSEVDYMIQYGNRIIPLEVKSGSTGSLKSLHLFMHLKKLPLAIRINSDLPSITQVETKLHDGTCVSYKLLSIPFYLVEQLPRLLKEVSV